MVTGLFVYFEGGHTFSEIFEPLEMPGLRKTVRTFLNDESANLTKKGLVFDSPEIMALMRKALAETVEFYSVLEAKKQVHEEIHRSPGLR